MILTLAVTKKIKHFVIRKSSTPCSGLFSWHPKLLSLSPPSCISKLSLEEGESPHNKDEGARQKY